MPTKKTPPVTQPKPTGRPLAKTKDKHPISGAPLATIINAEEDAGVGQEGMTSQDFSIPRLVILQGLSPQLKKNDEAFIKGAEEGDICDTINARVFKTDGGAGVTLIPVSYRRTHLEWKSREQGGGFVQDHGPESDILSKTARNESTGANVLPNGNNISVVAEYFCFMLDETGTPQPYVLSMTGSQMKKARRWNTVMSQYRVPKADGTGHFNPAMFYRSYTFTTVPESNPKGSWYGWKIIPGKTVLELPHGADIYQAAREFRAQVATGAVKVTPPARDSAHETESDTSPM